MCGSLPFPTTIEADLQALIRAVTQTERQQGTNRRCTYGLRPDRTYFVELPDGYGEAIADLKAKYGDAVTFHVVSWALLVDWREAALTEAPAALREALIARGIDPDTVQPGTVRIDSGSRLVGRPPSPHFRVWIRKDVLSGDTPVERQTFEAEGAAALARLLAACPSFEADPDEADLSWVAAGSVGLHLIELLDGGRVDEVRDVLATMEAVVTTSPAIGGAINLITTGLMEAIAPSREDFARLLGPESLRWWRGVNAYLAQEQRRLEPRDT